MHSGPQRESSRCGWSKSQIGAALASYLGGLVRVSLGDYTAAFLGAGLLAILASLMVLVIRREPTTFGPEAEV